MMRFFIGFFLLLAGRNLLAQCDNRALHFDGDGDFVTLSPLPATFPANTDFSVSAWFKSEATGGAINCSGSFRRLLCLGGPSSRRFELGECNGLLSVYTNPGITIPVNMSTTSIRDGAWHHLVAVRAGSSLEVYLDCTQIYTNGSLPATGFTFTVFRVGHWTGGATPSEDWQGPIDDVRLWNQALTPAAVADACGPCIPDPATPGLLVHWNLDQGVAEQNNTGITQAMDASTNANNGALAGFGLLAGTTSNFICSDASLVYPDLYGSTVELRGMLPVASPLITEICSGDPVHFCLKKDGATPQPPPAMTAAWEFRDGAGPWQPVTDPAFIGLCFVDPAISIPCAGSATGFVDRDYRAQITLNDPPTGSCVYTSDPVGLRICCPISPATVTIAVAPPGLLNGTLCAGDVADLTVTLTSPDLFVQSPGAATTIEWYRNGIHQPAYDDQTGFTVTGVTATVPAITFEAKVYHCSKTASFSNSITVDPVPVCGTIDKAPLCTTLTPVTAGCPVGMTCYEICPDNDASLAIVTPFSDCTPQWQYSFDLTTWYNLGFSNTIQNTNQLPGDWPFPTGNPPIHYRIQCNPLHNPSGCEPCLSNIVRVQFSTPPAAAAISGPNQACKSLGSVMLNATPVGSYTYTWYLDGELLGSTPTHTLNTDKSGCYKVEVSNGCQTTISAEHCLELCETIAAITCPLDPNACAQLGVSVTLDACTVSKSTCGGDPNTFTYSWNWTDTGGSTGTGAGCTISHTPPMGGTQFTVTVTDPATGCAGSATRTVAPCDFN